FLMKFLFPFGKLFEFFRTPFFQAFLYSLQFQPFFIQFFLNLGLMLTRVLEFFFQEAYFPWDFLFPFLQKPIMTGTEPHTILFEPLLVIVGEVRQKGFVLPLQYVTDAHLILVNLPGYPLLLQYFRESI